MKLHHEIARERADEYGGSQRRAFLDGFEAAMAEAESMDKLREWLEEERDKSYEKYQKNGDQYDLTRRMTLIEVLVKLAEMGCDPEVDDVDE